MTRLLLLFSLFVSMSVAQIVSSSVIDPASSGTVSSGTAGQPAYFAATGTTISGFPGCVFSTSTSPNIICTAQDAAHVVLRLKGAAVQSVNILDIHDSAGLALFSVGSVGAIAFRNASNSTTGFQILDAAGAVIVNVDTTNKRWGIGTTIPATVAHVVRGLEGSVPSLLTFSTIIAQHNEFVASDALVTLLAGTSGKSIVEFADSGDRDIGFISYDHAANSMQFGTNAVSNRIFIDSSGNVCIGCAAPTGLLEVGSDSFAADVLTLNAAQNQNLISLQSGGTDRGYLRATDAGAVSFHNSSTPFTQLTLLSNGFAGIGPANIAPDGTLEVVDETVTTGDTRVIFREGDSTSLNLFELQDNAGLLGWGFLGPTIFGNPNANASLIVRPSQLTGSSSRNALRFASNSPHTTTAGVSNFLLMNDIFAPASGTAEYNILQLAPTIDQTGVTGTPITRGLFINPTLTSALDFRAIEVAVGKSIFFGNVGFGTAFPARIVEISVNTAVFRIADADATTADLANPFIEFGKNGGGWQRFAFVGLASSSNDDFTIKNESSGGNILLTLTGAGVVDISSGTIVGKGTKHDGYVIQDSAEVQTTDATVTVLDTLTLLDENTYHVEVLVVGVKSDGTDRASYHLAATVYRTGAGSATLQGGVTSLHTQESNASWDANFTVSGNDVRVSVTGVAATTVEWGTTLKFINMSN